MRHIRTILIPTDLTDHSRRALLYGASLATHNEATITILHIARDLRAWAYVADEMAIFDANLASWPQDRVLAEARLDLNRFLDEHLPALKRAPRVTKRVVLGQVAGEIVAAATDIRADLVIMSPRRNHRPRRWLSTSITDQVTRQSPCPVLSVTEPLPSPSWRGRRVRTPFGSPRIAAAGA